MNYWILTLPRLDMEHCIKLKTFGLNSKQRLGQMAEGDRILCCVTGEKPWKIIAIGKVLTSYYVDDKPIFRKPGGFWYRFDFDAKQFRPDGEIDFQALLAQLSFITNLNYWPVYFKGGVKGITEHDWEILTKAVE